jgi:hypothetical protein
LPNGLNDTTFFNNGIPSNYAEGVAHRPFLFSNGTFAVARSGLLTNVSSIRRYLSDGSLDSTFAQTSTQPGEILASPSSLFSAVAKDAEERIIAVGQASTTTTLSVSRFLSNGDADQTFGSNGIANTDFSSFVAPVAVGVKGDGRIVVAGWSNDAVGSSFVVLQYLP